MLQADLDRAVARATGESITTIRSLGFLLDEPDPDDYDPAVIDWDALESQRYVGSHESERCASVMS